MHPQGSRAASKVAFASDLSPTRLRSPDSDSAIENRRPRRDKITRWISSTARTLKDATNPVHAAVERSSRSAAMVKPAETTRPLFLCASQVHPNQRVRQRGKCHQHDSEFVGDVSLAIERRGATNRQNFRAQTVSAQYCCRSEDQPSEPPKLRSTAEISGSASIERLLRLVLVEGR